VDSKRTHLAIIRAVILRMAAASWVLRAWSVAIVSALVAVAMDAVHAHFAWLAVLMALVFWMLDAHFHRQERLYRKVYRRVRTLEEDQVDFSMDTAPVDSERDAWTAVLLSRRLGAFYGALVACIAVARIVAQ
jgi:uncharacterized membrane protein